MGNAISKSHGNQVKERIILFNYFTLLGKRKKTPKAPLQKKNILHNRCDRKITKRTPNQPHQAKKAAEGLLLTILKLGFISDASNIIKNKFGNDLSTEGLVILHLKNYLKSYSLLTSATIVVSQVCDAV